MKKIILLAFFSMVVTLHLEAQQSYSKLKLTGFDITVVPSKNFKLERDKSIQLFETMQGDVLVLRALNSKKREKIRILAKSIEQIEVEDCSLVFEKVTSPELKIIAKSNSLVKVHNVDLRTLTATIDGGASMEVSGKIQTLNCEVKGTSSLRIIDNLATNDMKLNISAASKANVSIAAQYVEVVAKSASEIVMAGTASTLNLNANMAVKLDATALEVEKAKVFTARGCVIDLNAKTLDTNEPVGNIAKGSEKLDLENMKLEDLENMKFEDLFK